MPFDSLFQNVPEPVKRVVERALQQSFHETRTEGAAARTAVSRLAKRLHEELDLADEALPPADY
jgi:hypothetical protein